MDYGPQLKVRAPGSSILLGEYAVLDGSGAIVGALNCDVELVVSKACEGCHVHIRGPLGEFSWEGPTLCEHPYPYMYEAIELFFAQYPFLKRYDLLWDSKTNFGIDWGLGSSAAITVATLVALHHLYNIDANFSSLFSLGLYVITKVQGGGSGADLAASLLGGLIFFKKTSVGCTWRALDYEFIKSLGIRWVYMGYKTKTAEMIQRVRRQTRCGKEAVALMISATQSALKAIEVHDLVGLKGSLEQGQQALEILGCLDDRMRQVIKVYEEMGYRAKVSGSGLGDCILIFEGSEFSAVERKQAKYVDGQYLEGLSWSARGVDVEYLNGDPLGE